MAYVPTLKTQYKEQIVAALMKEFGYSSVLRCLWNFIIRSSHVITLPAKMYAQSLPDYKLS